MNLPAELSGLTWTTRDDVAARLADFLRTSDPAPKSEFDEEEDSPRARAAELLRLFATSDQQECLRSLALSPQEEVGVRRTALHALSELEAGISAVEFTQLLADAALMDESNWFGPQDLLVLAQSPETQDAALRYLSNLTPDERSRLLAVTYDVTPARLLEWMFEQWRTADRHLVPDLPPLHGSARGYPPVNQLVIGQHIDRPEVRAVLQGLWHAATGADRRVWAEQLSSGDVVRSFPGELTAAETAELADCLELPAAALEALWGRERLFEVLDGHLITEHERQVAQRRLRKSIVDEDRRFIPTLHVLRYWQDPMVDEWITERAVGSELCHDVRSWLMISLWERNRPQFANAIVRALAAEDYELARQFIAWTRFAPVASDRPAFSAAAASPSAELQYYALCGLECLGESGEDWHARLMTWTQQEEPRLRIRALGALARRGDLAALSTLLAWTEVPHPLAERAEAIATLGALDSTAHLSLLIRALAHEEHPEEGHFREFAAPVAEEAALALARLATPEALTALVRSYLTSETRYLWTAVGDYLAAIVEAERDSPPTLALRPEGNWNHVLRVRWRD